RYFGSYCNKYWGSYYLWVKCFANVWGLILFNATREHDMVTNYCYYYRNVLFYNLRINRCYKGIKILSNINLVVAGLLLLFVLALGPTRFILEDMVTTLGGYITNFVKMSLTLTPLDDNGWLGANTIF